jgi:putative protease
MATKKKVKKTVKRPVAKKRPVARKAKKAVKRAVKKAVKKSAKKTAPKKIVAPKAIGRVTHFYREIKVAVIKFSKPVKQGTEVSFRGATTDFKQKLDSMQYDHKSLATAPKGKQVGVKVKSRVREGDQVYL